MVQPEVHGEVAGIKGSFLIVRNIPLAVGPLVWSDLSMHDVVKLQTAALSANRNWDCVDPQKDGEMWMRGNQYRAPFDEGGDEPCCPCRQSGPTENTHFSPNAAQAASTHHGCQGCEGVSRCGCRRRVQAAQEDGF